MPDFDLSIIIPSRNVQDKIRDIVISVSKEIKDLNVEFIIIDMDSSDSTVFKAVSAIKEENISGCVIQSGSITVSAALNMGIFKARGKYITFLFPKRLYKNFICDYYRTATEEDADFIFATPPFAESKNTAARINLNNISGEDLAIGIIKSIVYIDFGAIMLKTDFVAKHHIRFFEECSYGYAEAFIFRAIMEHPKISYSSALIQNDDENRVKNDDETDNAKFCFERVESMLKIFELMNQKCKDNKLLLDIFEYQKIPETVFSCIDLLLESGFSYNAIRSSIRLKKYERLLKISKFTPRRLKKDITIWRTMPWMYKPRKKTKV